MSERSVRSRRRFLLGLAFGLPVLGGGLFGRWRKALAAVPVRQIALHHRHTGESVRTVYFADGRYLEEGLRSIDRLLRDWRTDEIVEIDPQVLDIAYLLQRQLDLSGPLEVLSGYRSPETNAMLRRRSRAVARNSLHMYGMAIDLRFPGVPLSTAHRAALALQAGGVGYYPSSDFLHIDSGPVRQWTQLGRVQSGRDGGVPKGAVANRRRAARQRRLAALKKRLASARR
ncbi:MAG: DUF882 domain-containing protein [Geminicoccaceae bacterium]|nr:DUF882 domain-containing protein [Geminicoccaceae bacterium]MDW8444038.1 DUF882 domain-containing protein [Acetobacteraceae bacterium]MCS7268179.1 DUF882 domain-containing protein [Geminicoccaceae bacterium]MCX7630706.1 DUF882 domain-containing protein [Geminicoccaceae bacterium]MDW8125951.1 DUF882 domain-containing protein [Geminicoccaceae bacterium]